ncbi:MAG: TonB-dependent receptor, partial [Candidatus Krumholzibacteria bacterium]|nr:TonB-dependent receptor [Candidatus Krumholzibacteria bacterium]
FRFHPASFLTLKGNWGRYYRLPTFFELFGNLGSVTGDNELEHEKGLNRDIGVTFSTGRFLFFDRPFLEAVYLSNEVENLILFFPNSQSTVKPKNIGSATIRGFELSLAFSILESINLSGNYCYLDGKDTSPIPYYNGNSLAGRPLHQAAFQIEFDKTRWRAAYELHYIGSNYLDRANMKELPARKIHNLSLNLRHPGRRVTLAIEAQNLGDNQVSDVSGFPLPGRSFYTTIRLKI